MVDWIDVFSRKIYRVNSFGSKSGNFVQRGPEILGSGRNLLSARPEILGSRRNLLGARPEILGLQIGLGGLQQRCNDD